MLRRLAWWCVFSAMAFAQDRVPPGLVGQIGGPVQAVTVSGNYVYAGIGLRMVVLAARTLEETGATRPFPQFVEDIAVDGTRAYVAAGGAGLRIVDVSDPARPVEIGAWNSLGYAEGVAVAGNIVYLADGPLGLRILDVSDPARPVELASAYVMENVRKVALAGRHAYLAAGGAGLLVVNVADPRRPVEAAALDTPGHAYHVAIGGDKAYIADGWEGVQVASIADPARPVLVGWSPSNGWAMHVHLFGGRALVANAGFGLLVLDLANPAQPAEIAAWDQPPIAAIGVAAAGDVAYIADRDWGVRAVDLSDQSAPRLTAGYATVTSVQSVAVQGHYAYAAAGVSGVQVVDISDPSQPVRVAGFAPGGTIPSLRVRGSLLYVLSWGEATQGLYILDVSDPTHPKQTGFFLMRPTGMAFMPGRPEDGEGAPRDLEIEGDVAYVANERGLILIGIADPANPAYLGQVVFPGDIATVDVAVHGGYAFVVMHRRLGVVDVSDPRAPSIAALLDYPSLGEGLAIHGNYLVMSNLGSEKALLITDITDPRNPRRVGSYVTAGLPFRLTAAGNDLYVADGEAGIHVVDLTQPARPVFAGAAETPGLAHEVAVTDDLLAVADGVGGLLLFDRRAVRNGVAAASARQPSPRQSRSSRVSEAPPPRKRLVAMNVPAQPRRPEPRRAAQGCVVTSTADAGTGSLRACLQAAAPGDTIAFSPQAFPPDNPATIRLASRLSPMSQGGITLDASDAGVILDGANVRPDTDMPGLLINSSDNVIRGLAFVNFPGVAAGISGGARNVIGGNRLLGAGPSGQGNRFSGNRTGVGLSAAEDNVITGNLFGVDAQGRALDSNRHFCMGVESASRRNRIGGAAAGEGNLFSGCAKITLSIGDPGTEYNQVIGNWMNTDITGLRPLGTGGSLNLGHGASFNQIGGLGPGEGNVLSGGDYGVYLSDVGTRGNRVLGNLIGTNAAATAAIPNLRAGVNLESNVSHTLIHGNLIWDPGVSFVGLQNYFNSVTGNRFVRAGVFVSLGAGFARIGGSAAAEANVFEQSNEGSAIRLGGQGGGSEGIVVGNRMGVDLPPATRASGVSLTQDARHNIIGGASPNESNRISGHTGDAIMLHGAGVKYNVVQGNRVGVDDSGTRPLPNRGHGIALIQDAARNFVQGNTIAFNAGAGVQVTGPENLLRRNSIHDNAVKGIQVLAGGAVLSAPALAAVTSTRVTGTTCPGCAVEIYSDNGEQGAVYEGAALADARGAFTFDKPGGLRGPKVQAVASSAKGTSEFSTCVQTVSPARLSIPAAGGNGSIDVTAPASCRWEAWNGESWIKLAGAGMRVNFTVAANTDGRPRSGAIVIGGQIVMVTQTRP